jgi:hypothetical protein
MGWVEMNLNHVQENVSILVAVVALLLWALRRTPGSGPVALALGLAGASALYFVLKEPVGPASGVILFQIYRVGLFWAFLCLLWPHLKTLGRRTLALLAALVTLAYLALALLFFVRIGYPHWPWLPTMEAILWASMAVSAWDAGLRRLRGGPWVILTPILLATVRLMAWTNAPFRFITDPLLEMGALLALLPALWAPSVWSATEERESDDDPVPATHDR